MTDDGQQAHASEANVHPELQDDRLSRGPLVAAVMLPSSRLPGFGVAGSGMASAGAGAERGDRVVCGLHWEDVLCCSAHMHIKHDCNVTLNGIVCDWVTRRSDMGSHRSTDPFCRCLMHRTANNS